VVAKAKIQKFLTFFYSIISSFLREQLLQATPLKYGISRLNDYLIGQSPASENWIIKVRITTYARHVNRKQTVQKSARS
jgi:hypothetical protein